MFKISTLYLDPDVHNAGVQHGSVSRGEMDAARIIALLEKFQSIEAMEMLDVDPQVIATGRDSKLIIRTNRKKLFVYNAENMNEAAIELTPAEIVQKLDGGKPAPAAEEGAQLPGPAAAPAASRPGVGYALLAFALLVNIYTVFSLFSKPPQIDDKSDVVFVTDAHEIAQKQQAVAGTYATGQG